MISDKPIIRFGYTERLLVIAGIFFMMFSAMAIIAPYISGIFGNDTRTALLVSGTVQNIIAFIIPALLGARLAFGNTTRFLRLDRVPSCKALAGAVILFVCAIPALNQIIYWNSQISFPEALVGLENFCRATEDQAAKATATMLSSTTVAGLIIEIMTVGVLTGFSEELFFRGTIQRTIASNGAPHTAIWITAFIFSALHFQIYGFLPRLLLGALFGYSYYWTGSIYTPVCLHILNNSSYVISTWLRVRGSASSMTDDLGIAESGFPTVAFISSVVVAAFLIFYRNYFFGNKTLSSNPD